MKSPIFFPNKNFSVKNMPARKKSVKFSKKGILKKRSSKKRSSKKRSSKKRSFKRRPYVKRKYPVKRVAGKYKRKSCIDSAGAKFLVGSTEDPAVADMYKGMISANSSGLNKVRVKGKSSLPDVFETTFTWMKTEQTVPVQPLSLTMYGNSIIDSGGNMDTNDAAYVAELSNLYSYYRVTSSRCTLHLTNSSSTAEYICILFKTVVPVAQWATFLPVTLAGWAVSSVPHKMVKLYNKGVEGSMVKLTDWCSTSAIFNNATNVEDFTGDMPILPATPGTVPVAPFQWYWGVQGCNVTGAPLDNDNTLLVNCEVTYWTTLDGPKAASDYQPGPEPEPVAEDPCPIYPVLKDPEYEAFKALKGKLLLKT